MMVNNEIGVIQPIAAIGALCRAKGKAFRCDAVQAPGKVPIDLRIACGTGKTRESLCERQRRTPQRKLQLRRGRIADHRDQGGGRLIGVSLHVSIA
jgi:hypothetical protein